MKKILLLLVGLLAFVSIGAQQRVVKGRVTDRSDGSPIPAVTISTVDKAGLKHGGLTDADGYYNIQIPQEASTLTFSFVGMKTVQEKIGNRKVINVVMEEDAVMTEEVVVTALGLTREAKSLNYARQSVDVDALVENNGGNIVSSLSGKIAGVQITPPGTNNGSARIVIRGTSSLTENSQPVFVIDGMIVENEPGDGGVTIDGGTGGLDMGNPVSDINPEDIENIEVLKGPNAAALYGSRAAQGVVLITTKKANSLGKAKISYNGNFQFEKVSQYMDYQNGWGTGENSFTLDHSLTLSHNGNQKVTDLPNLAGYNKSAGAKLRSWGAPLWGQSVYGHDGKLTTLTSHPENISDFFKLALIPQHN